MMDPKPMTICIEVCEADEPTYFRCVALPGRQAGLRLEDRAKILWKQESDRACELWVSRDNRLILYRPDGCVPVTVNRGGRTVDLPNEKPAILIHEDQLIVGETLLRVHFHGEARVIEPPTRVAFDETIKKTLRVAAAAAVMGSASMMAGCREVEIRETPPEVMPDEPPISSPGQDRTGAAPNETQDPAEGHQPKPEATESVPPIEIRETPPW